MLKNILKKIVPKIQEFEYDNLYASRSVIKNQFINKDATLGFYNEDIWKVVDEEVKSKIEQGITLYGEIVGFLPSGKHIQKGYDYGCKKGLIGDYPTDKLISVEKDGYSEHKFLVYRITYTKPDGSVIEFSWQQIKNYCQKYQLEHVKELYFGTVNPFVSYLVKNPQNTGNLTLEQWRDALFTSLCENYLEKDCKWCINKVPSEGVVVRRDGLETYSAYKLKSKRFLERETKELDKGEVNIEDDATVSDL